MNPLRRQKEVAPEQKSATLDDGKGAGLYAPDFVRRTQAVWSKVYGREVSREEAIEILRNVGWLAKTVVKATNGR